MSEYDSSEQELEEIERHGEFGKTNEKLGSGAYKEVYRGIDHERGIEVAWNQLRITQSNMKTTKYLQEIQFLQSLDHPNIIKFYSSWINEDVGTIIFITEWMSSGTLKEFTSERFKGTQTNLKPVKHWCRQILSGLEYLHTRDPPIIHRDIKCDNIFLDATSGRVKIGDLGLAREFVSDMALTVIGTPEFMAPDFYNEFYTEKVDVWAFGMAVIEMVTGETPYYGSNPVQIYRKVSEYELPEQLNRITDTELLDFIRICLRPEDTRPSCTELLAHSFLRVTKDTPKIVYTDEPITFSPVTERSQPVLIQPPTTEDTPTIMIEPSSPAAVANVVEDMTGVQEISKTATLRRSSCLWDKVDETSIKVRLVVEVVTAKGGEETQQEEVIEFELDVHEDVSAIASEMIEELSLPSSIYGALLTQIKEFISESGLNPQS